MNKVILIGRLTKDPELRNTTSGLGVCQITVAVSRRQGPNNSGPDADFISVTVWDKQAENVAKYLKKGSQVAVDGRIQTRNYENNEGKRVYVTEVIATNIQFLDSRNTTTSTITPKADEPSPFDFESSQPSQIKASPLDNDPFANFGEKVSLSDNDLPF